MEATAASGADPAPDFGTGRLFLADARLAVALLNYVRYGALKVLFGASREQANVLTFVLALIAADTAYETTKHVMHTRPHVPDVAITGLLLSEAAHGIAGPQSRHIPFLGTLLIVGAAGSLAVPPLRRL